MPILPFVGSQQVDVLQARNSSSTLTRHGHVIAITVQSTNRRDRNIGDAADVQSFLLPAAALIDTEVPGPQRSSQTLTIVRRGHSPEVHASAPAASVNWRAGRPRRESR